MKTTCFKCGIVGAVALLLGLPVWTSAAEDGVSLTSSSRILRQNNQQPDQAPPPGETGSANVAKLASDGSITGRLSLVDPMSGDLMPVQNIVVNFVQSGSIVGQTRPGADGRFVIDGLDPGAYSVIANGPGGFAAFRIQVEPADAGTRALPPGSVSIQLVVLARAAAQPAGVQIDATVIPPSDAKLIIAMYRAERLRQLTGGPFTTLRPGEVRYTGAAPR